jgi:hypothetical protein
LTRSSRVCRLAALGLLLIAAACPGEVPPEDAGPGDESPTFTRVKDEVFTLNCTTALCHGGSAPQRGLRLDADDVHENLVDVDAEEIDESTGDPWKLVVAGDPDNSLLYRALVSDVDGEWQGAELDRPADDIEKMPPDIDALASSKLDLIKAWIEAGALDD